MILYIQISLLTCPSDDCKSKKEVRALAFDFVLETLLSVEDKGWRGGAGRKDSLRAQARRGIPI